MPAMAVSRVTLRLAWIATRPATTRPMTASPVAAVPHAMAGPPLPVRYQIAASGTPSAQSAPIHGTAEVPTGRKPGDEGLSVWDAISRDVPGDESMLPGDATGTS